MFEQPLISFTQGCLIPDLVETGPKVLDKKIITYIFKNNFIFCHYLPLGKDVTFHLIKFESPSHRNALCQVWLKLAQWT